MVNQNPTCCANASVGLPHDTNCPAGAGAIAGTAWASGWKLHDERKAKERCERIATAVMSGFAASPLTSGWKGKNAARASVMWADALIAELDK